MMTLEEAIKTFEDILQLSPTLDETGCSVTEAMKVALSALRSVSREQVEKVWRGEWESTGAISCKCSKCNRLELKSRANEYNFCPYCMAPMTDEAEEMVMRRLEALNENRD